MKNMEPIGLRSLTELVRDLQEKVDRSQPAGGALPKKVINLDFVSSVMQSKAKRQEKELD
jgi:hypothetical protein